MIKVIAIIDDNDKLSMNNVLIIDYFIKYDIIYHSHQFLKISDKSKKLHFKLLIQKLHIVDTFIIFNINLSKVFISYIILNFISTKPLINKLYG